MFIPFSLYYGSFFKKKCISHIQAFSSCPFRKTKQLLWFADTLNANTTMPLLSPQDSPNNITNTMKTHACTPPHTHWFHYHSPHPKSLSLRPVPLLKYKLQLVAMTTTRVHKSNHRGTLHSLKIIGRIFFFWEGGQKVEGVGGLGLRQTGRRIWIKKVEGIVHMEEAHPFPLPRVLLKQMVPCGSAMPLWSPCERCCHKEVG